MVRSHRRGARHPRGAGSSRWTPPARKWRRNPVRS
jgi:hypothetical protein